MNSDYINLIPNIEKKSYLELGVGNCRSFKSVKSANKLSIDTNGIADRTCTTDEFFAVKNHSYDIVFIDADHSAAQVRKDYNNALDIALEWIVIHDLIPPCESRAQPRFCGDGYKFLHALLNRGGLGRSVYPMNENYGMTFIEMPQFEVSKVSDITYRGFVEFIKSKRLYSFDEMRKVLSR